LTADEIKGLMEKRRAGEELTDEERAQLSAFIRERRGRQPVPPPPPEIGEDE